jgi:hypothetical protein
MEERKVQFQEPGDEYMRPRPTQGSSSWMADFLVAKGIVRTRVAAEKLMVLFVIVILCITLWIIWPDGEAKGVDTSNVPDPREAVLSN